MIQSITSSARPMSKKKLLLPVLLLLCVPLMSPRPDASGTVMFSALPQTTLHNARVITGPNGAAAYTVRDLTYQTGQRSVHHRYRAFLQHAPGAADPRRHPALPHNRRGLQFHDRQGLPGSRLRAVFQERPRRNHRDRKERLARHLRRPRLLHH